MVMKPMAWAFTSLWSRGLDRGIQASRSRGNDGLDAP